MKLQQFRIIILSLFCFYALPTYSHHSNSAYQVDHYTDWHSFRMALVQSTHMVNHDCGR
jgi:hypothetical protein